MGTDIHGVFQRRNNETQQWEDIPNPLELHRDYQLFAVLAGVRNGFGFAGVKTGQPVVPISEPRGFPDDFNADADERDSYVLQSLEAASPWRREYLPQEDNTMWMGDHSYSWLTASEMLDWYANAPTVIKTGVLDRVSYSKWDHVSPPESYCGAVWGGGVITVPDNEVAMAQQPDWTHVQCEWDESLRTELAYFFDAVKAMREEHGEVRFVFGFDS